MQRYEIKTDRIRGEAIALGDGVWRFVSYHSGRIVDLLHVKIGNAFFWASDEVPDSEAEVIGASIDAEMAH